VPTIIGRIVADARSVLSDRKQNRISIFLLIFGLLNLAGGCGGPTAADNITTAQRSSFEDLLARAENESKSCPEFDWAAKLKTETRHARNQISRLPDSWELSDLNTHNLGVTAKLIATYIDSCSRAAKNFSEFRSRCHGEAVIGMAAEQVRRTLWCEPTHVNRTITAGHYQEQWVYIPSEPIRGFTQPAGYLYFTDGILTAIQDQR
jgi:hypothetical protein